MLDNLNLRSKMLAIATVPVNVLVVLALWAAALAGEPLMAAFGALGAVATMVVAYRAGGRHLARLAEITDAVERVAIDELPARIGGTYDPPAPQAEEESDAEASGPVDEIDELLVAVAKIGPSVQAAVDRRRKSANEELTNLVTGLARRDQSLLDRQIDHIDWLEDTEQNPDRLEQLFKLDHLATRLRRSSETVLVLAGSESTRPRGGAAPIATVLRVAMGETEAYTKIKLRAVDDAFVSGKHSFDVAHLVAELLDNATEFSAPDKVVELHAVMLTTGDYQVTVIDSGFGMDDEKLARANELVSNPPELDTSIGRSIGLIVVGRLAKRTGATVEISQTEVSGITATVVLPAAILASSAEAPAAAPIVEPEEPAVEAAVAEDDVEATEEPADASAQSARGRVTEDSSHALSKLLGLGDEISDLAESSDWAAPDVEADSAQPLSSRADREQTEAGAEPVAESPDDLEPEDATEAEQAAEPKQPARRRASQARKRPGGRRSKASRTLAEALPSGAAFDDGIESLLTDGDDAGDAPVEPDPTTPAPASPDAEAEAESTPETDSGAEAESEAENPASPEAAAKTAEPEASDDADAATSPQAEKGSSTRGRSRGKSGSKSGRRKNARGRSKNEGAEAARTEPVPNEVEEAEVDSALVAEVTAEAEISDDAVESAPPAKEPTPATAATDGEPERVMASEASPADDTWTAPGVTAVGTGGGLNRRQRNTAAAPVVKAPLAKASARKPEEIRSMITDYRKGLKGSKPTETTTEKSEDR